MKFKSDKESKPIKLDLKDKRILKLLDLNSKQSYSAIAKKVGLSKESIRYRIKQLEDKGVIQGYRLVVDMQKLGFIVNHIFMTLSKPDLKIEADYLDKLIKLPFVRAIIKFNGDYDYEIAMVAKNVEEIDNNLNTLLEDVSQFIKKQELFIVVKYYVKKGLPNSFLPESQAGFKKVTNETTKEPNIDEKDLKIIDAMKGQANKPIYQIAEETGYSSEVVSYRLKKMEKSGFISNYTIALNYYAFNYQVYVILLNVHSLHGETEQKLASFLENDNNVIWAVKTIGKYNVIAYVCTKSINELHETIDKIRRNFGDNLQDHKTLIAYENNKFTYVPDVALSEEAE